VKIDIFNHIYPKAFYEKMVDMTPKAKDLLGKRTRTIPCLVDLDVRFKVQDMFDDYTQVVSMAMAIESFCTPPQAKEMARLANDGMAELVQKYPDRFIAGVACLPLNNVDAALEEARRGITDLGFKGVLVDSPIYDYSAEKTKPIDLPEYMSLYEMMSDFHLPIWIHPRREASVSDYTTEKGSKYFIFHCFGWPYETTVAMARLVFSGVLETYPTLKLITHHAGAMVPFFADRIVKLYGYQEAHAQTGFMDRLKKPPIDYFKAFYNDTALYGSPAGLMCAYAFFGADHLLFGTDMPYDAEQGDQFTRETIRAIEQMEITDSEKKKIFEDNAMEILGLRMARSEQ